MRCTTLAACLLTAAALAPAACSRSPSVHFAREEVALTVRPGAVEVRANYHFKVRAARPFSALVFYPFPLDSFHSWPDSIWAGGLPYEAADSGVMLRLNLPARGEESLRVFYRQPHRGTEARYIVMTTRKWRRPIDLARFTVTVPREFDSVTLEHKPDSAVRGDSAVTYFITRRAFWPDSDIVVRWRP
jgi:hypothetical protein